MPLVTRDEMRRDGDGVFRPTPWEIGSFTAPLVGLRRLAVDGEIRSIGADACGQFFEGALDLGGNLERA